MPYLHWETDRARSKASRIIDKNGPASLSDLSHVADALINANARKSSSSTKQGAPDNVFSSGRELYRPRWSKDQTPLGRVLLLAASLYEAMDDYTDEKLLKEYLSAIPALHPRRTLDQSYYWTLEDSSGRDRDQVVYRATAPSPGLHYKFRKHGNHPRYDQCSENVLKTPRLVMVDQLWMWILDDSKSSTDLSELSALLLITARL